MALIPFVITARDSTVAVGDNRKTGLSPGWSQLKRLSDGASVSHPTFTEIGLGQYKFWYDAASSGEASGQVDLGVGFTNPGDRYVDVMLTLADSTGGDGDTPVTAATDTSGGLYARDAGGHGIADVIVTAYTASDYATGLLNPIAQVTTKDDGSWEEAMWLNHGVAYTFTYVKVGLVTAAYTFNIPS